LFTTCDAVCSKGLYYVTQRRCTPTHYSQGLMSCAPQGVTTCVSNGIYYPYTKNMTRSDLSKTFQHGTIYSI
jgi:hypothetical protein